MQVDSGSEKSITPEDKWIFENSTWTYDEASGHPATSTSATAAADDIMDEDDPEASDGDDPEASDGDDPEETEESEEDY